MKNLSIIPLFLLIILSGCTSMSDQMNSYVGKDIREYFLDHGQAHNYFDLGEGKRAFQWNKSSSYTAPTHTTTTGHVTSHGGSSQHATATVNATSISTGGQTHVTDCIFTLLADWDDSKKSWIITGSKELDFECDYQ